MAEKAAAIREERQTTVSDTGLQFANQTAGTTFAEFLSKFDPVRYATVAQHRYLAGIAAAGLAESGQPEPARKSGRRESVRL